MATISMHDFTFEHGINTISIKKIYLIGGFRPSYVFIPLGCFDTIRIFFIRIMAFPL